MKTLILSICLVLLLGVFSYPAQAQSSYYAQRFNNGISLYNLERYYDAAIEFRRAQETAIDENDWSAAIYWVIISELGYSDYGSALIDMEELERRAPDSVYTRDMAYHRGRVYFNQGFFENALLLFRKYIDSVTETSKEALDRKAAAFYWMGECLFKMGQFNEAERFYTVVVDTYPASPKKEISSYRIDLIKQKKIEAELLALLQWSHEESLRTSEEYQRRIRTYEYTLNAYQRRIADLSERNENVKTNEQLPFQEDTVSILDTQMNPVITDFFPAIDFKEYAENQSSNLITTEYHEFLIEKARLLGIELEQLIIEYERGGALLW